MLYVSYYTTPDDCRVSSPAATMKTLYIAEALAQNDIAVKIISCNIVASHGKYIRGRNIKIAEKITCKQFSMYNTDKRFWKKVQYAWSNVKLFTTLLLLCKKGENVLFYHAIERGKAVLLAKKFKKFRLILEVEEIYANARKLREKEVEIEKQVLKSADAYIFPTELLNKKINVENKPYVIAHGTYREECILNTPKEDKVHIVYAGTLDAEKGGAFAAVNSAEFLSDSYKMHILGFGTEEEIMNIKNAIKKVSAKKKCEVSYEGCLYGTEYIKFIQSCHIGLSTQNPMGNFNDTSFPSKILSYMANGLQVVSVRIPVVESSGIGSNIYYYDKQTPKDIASAIMSVKKFGVDENREMIRKLNEEFVVAVKKVLDI